MTTLGALLVSVLYLLVAWFLLAYVNIFASINKTAKIFCLD